MSESQNEFQAVKVIETRAGLRASITAREYNGRKWYSFTISKVFEKDGQRRTSKWLQKQHLPEVRKLLLQVEEAIELLEDQDLQSARTRG